ncbi:hypothetical protein DKM19_18975 [Streptosporangium sp. 'caverna']|nr:hypothetical protein DKM19_18975 [Streptosporangium sp. 'caverna']
MAFKLIESASAGRGVPVVTAAKNGNAGESFGEGSSMANPGRDPDLHIRWRFRRDYWNPNQRNQAR